MSNQEDTEAVECEHPYCQKALLDGRHTYVGEHGNELVLCGTHYYELVADQPPRSRKTNTSPITGSDLETGTIRPKSAFNPRDNA